MSVQDSYRTRSSSAMVTGSLGSALSQLPSLAAARRAAKDRTGRSLVMFAGLALGLALGATIRVVWPALGVFGGLSWTMAAIAICLLLAHEFWLWRVKRHAASSNPEDRELLAQVTLQDDLAGIEGLGLEAEAASKLKVQVWREHRAALLEERRHPAPAAMASDGRATANDGDPGSVDAASVEAVPSLRSALATTREAEPTPRRALGLLEAVGPSSRATVAPVHRPRT